MVLPRKRRRNFKRSLSFKLRLLQLPLYVACRDDCVLAEITGRLHGHRSSFGYFFAIDTMLQLHFYDKDGAGLLLHGMRTNRGSGLNCGMSEFNVPPREPQSQRGLNE